MVKVIDTSTRVYRYRFIDTTLTIQNYRKKISDRNRFNDTKLAIEIIAVQFSDKIFIHRNLTIKY